MATDYEKCPERYRKAFHNYIEEHTPTGDCFKAILANNLREALGRADDQTEKDLRAIVIFLMNEAPAECWGTREKVDAWLKARITS